MLNTFVMLLIALTVFISIGCMLKLYITQCRHFKLIDSVPTWYDFKQYKNMRDERDEAIEQRDHAIKVLNDIESLYDIDKLLTGEVTLKQNF